MKCLRHCVSQTFAIFDSDSNTEATYQASETRHHVTFDSVTKGRGRDTKYFCLPVPPKKRVRSSSLPPISVLKYTTVDDSIQASGEHNLVNLHHIMETDECLLSLQKRKACVSLICSKLYWCVYLSYLDRIVPFYSGSRRGMSIWRSCCGSKAVVISSKHRVKVVTCLCWVSGFVA